MGTYLCEPCSPVIASPVKQEEVLHIMVFNGASREAMWQSQNLKEKPRLPAQAWQGEELAMTTLLKGTNN